MKKGFSVIELLVVLAIVGIMGAVMGPMMGNYFVRTNTKNIVNNTISSLENAKMYSMMGKNNGPWGVKFGPSAIVLFQGTSYILRNSAFDQSYALPTSITASGMSELIFSTKNGTPSATGTVTITSNANLNYQITISQEGTVTLL